MTSGDVSKVSLSYKSSGEEKNEEVAVEVDKQQNQQPQWSQAKKKDDSSSSSSFSESSSSDEGKAAIARNKRKVQVKKKRRTAAWVDEEDQDYAVKDKTATYQKAVGKHGRKEFSEENYAQTLRKQFTSLNDTPNWADLDARSPRDSDDEFFRVMSPSRPSYLFESESIKQNLNYILGDYRHVGERKAE